MLYKYNGITYTGILPIDIITFKQFTQKERTKVIALVQNEDILEWWQLDPTNITEAIEELVKYYTTEEPWGSWQEMTFYCAAFEHSCAPILKRLIEGHAEKK